MSIQVMSEVWELDLPSNLKLTLLGFADHADDKGVCYPSVDRVAWKSGVSRRTVQRHIRELEEIGVIRVHEGGGRGNTNRYTIRPEKGDRLTPFRSGKGDTVTERASTTTKNGDTDDTRTISNRQSEPSGAREGDPPRENGAGVKKCGECGDPASVHLREDRSCGPWRQTA